MYFYALIWAIPALVALAPSRGSRSLRGLMLASAAIALTLVVGLRFEVGGDWYNYIEIHNNAVELPSPLWLAAAEPAYALLNRLASDPDNGIIIVNLVCAAIYVSGLVLYCRDQPLPALALVVAIPYLTIVVAMGYTRQSAALGLFFMALTLLRRGRVGAYLALTILASLFHYSALATIPLLLVRASPRMRIWVGLLIVAAVPVLFTVLGPLIGSKFDYYVTKSLSSEGAIPRIGLNLVPAAIFLGWRGRFHARWPEDSAILTALSLAAFATTPLLAFASTTADRFHLFLAALQIAVYARVPLLLRGHWRAAAYAGVILLYGGVLALWLGTSFYAACCWIPYRWVL